VIITSNSQKDRWRMWDFLKAHGVDIPKSTDFQALGRENKELALIGVVGYNGFCGKVCSIHVAGDGNWVSPELLWAAFDYPFNQLGLNHIFGAVAGDNRKAQIFDQHLGFRLLSKIPDGWDTGVDLMIYKMSKKDCKWSAKSLSAAKLKEAA